MTWKVLKVVSVTDGDTLRVIRERVIDIDGRRFRVIDDDPRGVPVRLWWVDTPERGKPGWLTARNDLLEWISLRTDFTVTISGSAGWDRLLGDFRSGSESASQWLMIEGGWPPFTA